MILVTCFLSLWSRYIPSRKLQPQVEAQRDSMQSVKTIVLVLTTNVSRFSEIFFFLDLLSLWMFVVPPCLHLLFLTKLSPPDLSDQRGKKHYDWNKVGAAANTARCQNSRNRKSFNFLWGELPIMCRGCFLITAQPEKGSWQNLFRAFSRHNFGKLLIDVFNILRMKKILTHQPT